jgi:hypothetical protein
MSRGRSALDKREERIRSARRLTPRLWIFGVDGPFFAET